MITVFSGDPFLDMLCKTKIAVNYSRCKMRCRINRSMVEYIAHSSDFRWNAGLLISHSVVMNCGVSLQS